MIVIFSVLGLINKSIKFERKLFDNKKGGFPRAAINYEMYSNYWCHGNGGILLSRLILKENGYIDEYIDKEIEFCIRELIDKGLGYDFCLCHGDMGNLLILYKAAKVLENEKLKNRVLHTFIKYVEMIRTENLLDKEFKFKEKNSLMIGITGLGYGILNFIYYDKMPFVLALE